MKVAVAACVSGILTIIHMRCMISASN